jgi:hypothetical protein
MFLSHSLSLSLSLAHSQFLSVVAVLGTQTQDSYRSITHASSKSENGLLASSWAMLAHTVTGTGVTIWCNKAASRKAFNVDSLRALDRRLKTTMGGWTDRRGKNCNAASPIWFLSKWMRTIEELCLCNPGSAFIFNIDIDERRSWQRRPTHNQTHATNLCASRHILVQNDAPKSVSQCDSTVVADFIVVQIEFCQSSQRTALIASHMVFA